MRFGIIFLFAVVVAAGAAPIATKSNQPEALLLIMGDQHSAYERTAQFVALVDQLKADQPALPLAILLNGDTLEYGNVVARRSVGVVDFAMFSALARRAPTILNLGNHEPEFYDLNETVRRIEATGVKVISNIVDHATGQPFAPASIKIKLGFDEATIVGVTTDHLSTYRLAVRPSLDLANPAVWAKQNFSRIFATASLPVVMSHAGLTADREILGLVPDGTLFAGGHDHLRFVHPIGRGVYFHSGSWNEYVSLAWLRRDAAGSPVWSVEQIQIPSEGPADPELAEIIKETRQKNLTSEDMVPVGRSKSAMSPGEAARWVTRILAGSAGVDAAFIGNTTFGAGLPSGEISRIEFDACIRFDGSIFVADVEGVRLRALLSEANQGTETKFESRRGEFLIACGPASIDPAKHYRIATTDWGARNSQNYFGLPAVEWHEFPGAKFKARVIEGLKEP
jgi:5'-nucleotidase / UDP-sugar diphosphatase